MGNLSRDRTYDEAQAIARCTPTTLLLWWHRRALRRAGRRRMTRVEAARLLAVRSVLRERRSTTTEGGRRRPAGAGADAEPGVKPRPSAVEAARRASEDLCGWPGHCHHGAVADVWARGPQGVDRRPVCATHLTVATVLGYQQGEPPSGEAVGG